MRGARPATVWLSGRFLAAAEATLPATSQSLLAGLGLFESMRLSDARLPLLDLHLERLRFAGVRLGLELEARNWDSVLCQLAARNGIRDGRVRLTLGDGFELASCQPLPDALPRERREGISLQLLPLQRTIPDLKGISRLDLELAERAAGGEVALLSRGDEILETTRSNLFVVSDRGIETAPEGDVLPGIARRLVIQLARTAGLRVIEKAPSIHEREGWHEIFATNAVRGVRGVRELDRSPLPSPAPGEVTRSLQRALDPRMLVG